MDKCICLICSMYFSSQLMMMFNIVHVFLILLAWVLGMLALIHKEINYGSLTTPLTNCFGNCFSVYDRFTPYSQCCKFDQFTNIDTPYAQHRIRMGSAILRNRLNSRPSLFPILVPSNSFFPYKISLPR